LNNQTHVEFDVGEMLDPGWSVAVRLSGVVVGHIRPHPPTGTFRYVRKLDEVRPFYEDRNLASLMRRVSVRP
jgi:hypothetical protein